MTQNLQTNFNKSPFWDDFDEENKFYRILFRPSIPVQNRELIQVQSMIQNQISKFGSWAFNNGDVVSGCSISDMPNLPYVRLADFASNTSSNSISYVANSLVNTYITSVTSNLTAQVVYANNGLLNNFPATNIVYLKYLNSGTSQESVFNNNELLTIKSVTTAGNVAICNVYSISSNATGISHAVSISKGVIFINGIFVLVEENTVGLVNTYSYDAGNNIIGFALSEKVITENDDDSLFDNSQGSPNYNAPGAWRLKLEPYIISVDPTNLPSSNTSFNPIAVYNNNSLILKTSTANNLQSQIGDAVAANIYDSDGNYVVNPFVVDTVSKTSNNVYMNARIQPGLGYAQGYKINLLKTAYVDVRRGVDTSSLKSQQITVNYGNYVGLNEVSGNFDFDKYQTVILYDTAQKAITNHLWSSTNPTGNVVGTAVVKEFEYSSGTPGTNTAVYNLYLSNIILNSGISFAKVKSIYFSNSGSFGIGDLSTALQYPSSSLSTYGFSANALFTLRDTNNNLNTQYVYRKKLSNLNLTASGNVTVTITTSPTGGIDILPYGSGRLPDSIQTKDIIVVPQANTTMNITNSNVSISNTSNTIIGSSTTFITDFEIGDTIKINNDIRNIVTIANNTSLNVDAPFSSSNSSQILVKWIPAGKYINLSTSSYKNRGVFVTNTTSMVIATGLSPANSVSCTVYYNALRTSTSPHKKVINKNRFVRIDTSAGNPKGPWCLGFHDIHNVSKVYAANNSYGTNGIDLTSSFVFDNGQKDDNYGLGYLYAKGNIDLSVNKYLTVVLDYFSVNNAVGIGFTTIDSYPIDDINTSNVNAITTKDVPLYLSPTYGQIALRDVVDFRPFMTPTANNTGSVDLSNSASVSTAISYSTINPSANTTLRYDNTYGVLTPSVGSNFQSDLQFYLPRKDMFFFSTNGLLKIKEGVSSLNPQSPLAPDNCMPVAILNIPPFPSLTTDQLDIISAVNKNAYTLIRESNNPVLVTLITNRRYTMKDIGKLDTRISNIEQLVSLNLLEASASQLTITNSQNQNAFKNGIFADPFNNYALSDVSNPEYRIAIDGKNSIARPFISRNNVPITYNANNSTTQKTGRAITLPYTEVVLLSQPYATEYRAAARLAFRWNGTCMLYPSYSNSKDMVNTGSIQVTLNNSTPWQQFAASPFGTIYGDWNTTTSVDTQTSVSGTVNTIVNDSGVRNVNISYQNFINHGGDVNKLGYAFSNSTWLKSYLSSLGYNFSGKVVAGAYVG